MGLLDRLKVFVGREKSDRPMGNQSGLSATAPVEWFQVGMRPNYTTDGGAVVEACVQSYAQTVAQLPGKHYEKDENGVKSYVMGSRLARVLAQPNNYQTSSDFLLNLVYSILKNGNGYWFGDWVNGERPREIFLLDPNVTQAHVVKETGDIFYSTSGMFMEMADANVDGRVMIPERYIGHVRLHTPVDPLIGVTPLQNAASSVAANAALVNHQANFFANMSRPSGLLSTELDLKAEQIARVRKAWEDRSKDLNSGGVPILGGGMKWQSLSLSSQDAQLVEAWRMTVEDISRVFRVPPMLINNMENSTFDNAETLMRFWLSSGLGFLINHIELALAKYYGLDARHEGVEYDTEVLLRSDLKARLEAMGVGVTKGIYSPNEARSREGLAAVEGGDMPRVQQQMVPLDWEHEPASAGPTAIPAPDGTSGEEDETATNEELAFLEYLVRGQKYAA